LQEAEKKRQIFIHAQFLLYMILVSAFQNGSPVPSQTGCKNWNTFCHISALKKISRRLLASYWQASLKLSVDLW